MKCPICSAKWIHLSCVAYLLRRLIIQLPRTLSSILRDEQRIEPIYTPSQVGFDYVEKGSIGRQTELHKPLKLNGLIDGNGNIYPPTHERNTVWHPDVDSG